MFLTVGFRNEDINVLDIVESKGVLVYITKGKYSFFISFFQVKLFKNEVKGWILDKLPSHSLKRISSKGGVDIDFFEVGKYVSRRHGKIYKKCDRRYCSNLGSKHSSETYFKL